MHLALVEPVREESLVARWGDAGTERQPWRPLERVKLGFESELGQRLAAALEQAEEQLLFVEELFAHAGADIRPAVRERLAALPDGVRLVERVAKPENVALERPTLDRAVLASSTPPWTGWGERPPPRPVEKGEPSSSRSAPALRPRAHVAPPITEEPVTMPTPAVYTFKGQSLTVTELLRAGRSIVPSRRRSWSCPRRRPASPPPVPKKAKREDAPAASEPAPAAAPSSGVLDPAELLAHLGFRIEHVGQAPRGRVFLLVEAPEA